MQQQAGDHSGAEARAAAAAVEARAEATRETEATAAAMAAEVALLEKGGAAAHVRALLSVRSTYLLLRMSRCWRVWAVVASLPVREARGALAALGLRQQQEHGVHMRLQAAQQAEVARLKVENLEARLLLHKAEAIDQLRPTHPAVTDKERIAEA